MQDKLIKAVARNGNVRIYALRSTNLVEKARLQHDLWPTSLAAMGRLLSVTVMMASMLKEEDHSIIVQLNGGGPIGTCMVQAYGNGQVKGFVGDNEIYLKYNESNKLAVGLAVGNQGYLQVTKDMKMKDKFTGQVALQTGEIGDDFAYYFAVSEQTPSVVSLGVLVDTDYSCKASGGLLIQLMPNALEEDIVVVEEVVKHLQPISSLIEEGKLLEDIVTSLFNDAKILESKQVGWHCDCSKDRFKGALSTLKEEDLIQMIEEDHQAEVKCEYCNTKYIISEEELKFILGFKRSCLK